MKDIDISKIAKNIYDLGEDYIYDLLENFTNNPDIDKSLTYIYIKAFYIHSVKLYLENNKKMQYFDEIYSEYKNYLIEYYKNNNYKISAELIEDIKNAFDKSFEITESISVNDIYDGYEYRHHIIVVFELLKNILEKKSKCDIKEDIFDNYISKIKEKSEEIMDYLANQIKWCLIFKLSIHFFYFNI